MPSSKSWGLFMYVNIAFIIYIAGVFYYNQVAEIKANWPLYRCNPMYMFLADNVEENFTYCIQSMQTNYMGYLLEPITYTTDLLGSTLNGYMDDINSIRGMFDKVRTFFSNITQSIFGVFLNLVIEFQKIIIGIKDLFMKQIGTVATMMYVLDGSIKTMNSAWKGPSGQLVRALGKCFYPETKIRLKNGNIVAIKDINLGDILENGSVVYSTMKIDNKNNKEDLYCIKEKGVNGENINVTGSHLVFDQSKNKFIKVSEYHKAVKSNIKTEWFSCLITSDHKIKIGSEIFWDWEDHFIKTDVF